MLLQELIIYILYINSKEFHNILTYFHFLGKNTTNTVIYWSKSKDQNRKVAVYLNYTITEVIQTWQQIRCGSTRLTTSLRQRGKRSSLDLTSAGHRTAADHHDSAASYDIQSAAPSTCSWSCWTIAKLPTPTWLDTDWNTAVAMTWHAVQITATLIAKNSYMFALYYTEMCNNQIQ